MPDLSIPQSSEKSNPPVEVSKRAESIGGEVIDSFCFEDQGNKGICYTIKMPNDEQYKKDTYHIRGISIFDKQQADEKAQISIYINNKNIFSSDIDINNELSAYAFPAGIFNSDNQHKNVKLIINYNEKVFNIYVAFLPCPLNNLILDDYILLIPMAVKNKTEKHKIKYSMYTILFDGTYIKISCPNIIINGKSNIYKPDFIIPRRPYPVWVYIYAIYLYKNVGLTLREAAEEVKKKYELEKFSYSSLSRIVMTAFNDILTDDKYKILYENLLADWQESKIKKISENKTKSSALAGQSQKLAAKMNIKKNIINNFLHTLPKEIYSDDQINNYMMFTKAWYHKFSKHFLISSANSKIYATP